jgi:hypothetical protein
MTTTERSGVRVLTVPAEGPAVCDEQSALDLIGDAYGSEADMIAVPVERLCADFFQLRTGVAGGVVQKFANYRLRLVVVGDPAHHGPTSGPVDDWMREANGSSQLWFVADDAELTRRLEAGR